MYATRFEEFPNELLDYMSFFFKQMLTPFSSKNDLVLRVKTAAQHLICI